MPSPGLVARLTRNNLAMTQGIDLTKSTHIWTESTLVFLV